MTLHVRPHRSLAALTLLLAACTGQPQPLEKPLAPELALPGGLRVVLLDADLPAVADTVRLAVGKTLDVKVPDWPLPTAANGQYSGFTTAAPLDALALTWSTPQHLRLTATLGKMAGGFSLVQTGQAGCGLTWQVDGGSVQLEAEVVRQSDASLAVQLSGAPVATWEGASVSDASACLAKLPPADASSPGDAILAEVTQQLAKRLSAAFLPTVSRVFAASLEQSGRLATVGSVDPAVETRFALKYVEDAAHVALHSGASAQASLAVSVDADRHPCADDVPLPVAVASPLAQRSPPSGQAFLRRALVIDQALVQRLAWLAARAGALCAQTHHNLTTNLAPGWAADLLPQVDEWIEGPPSSARFWPGSSPTTRLVDTPAGAAVEWTMDDGQLEIIAHVADTEMTVLTVTGGFRATLLPRLQGTHALAFDLVSVERLSTHQSSPLLGDLATPASEAALSTLCEAALQGIFANQAVLPLLALTPGPLPPGTVLTGVDRTGDALWLWLEGGQTP